MSSIMSLFNIAKTSLFANQSALQVTSNNIANVATEGYSRETVVLESSRPESSSVGQLGTGVNIASIERSVDTFIEKQLTGAKQDLGKFSAKDNIMARLDSLVNDNFGIPVGSSLSEFFNSTQELANNVDGIAERSTVLSKARLLSSNLNFQSANFKNLRSDINDLVNSDVKEINNTVLQIFQMNQEVARSEIGGNSASVSRDKLQTLLGDLSKKIDISYFSPKDSSAVSVTTGGGVTLVDKEGYKVLNTSSNSADNGMSRIGYTTGGGTFIDITNGINSGELAGFLYTRDTVLPKTIGDLDKFAASVTNEVNQIHRTGFGLGGVGDTGNNFFKGLVNLTESVPSNKGGASIGAGTISDSTALDMNNYEIRFTDPATYSVVNTDSNTTLSTGNAYVSGNNITVSGMQAAITDGTGAPAAGDKFRMSASRGAAALFSVSLSKISNIAAAQVAASLPGDNTNIIAISNLQNSKLMQGKTETFSEFYGSTVEFVGIEAQQANREVTSQGFIVDQVQNRRDSVSGVSMDEELTNLIIFQRGYEASAKLISVTDELLQTLINLV